MAERHGNTSSVAGTAESKNNKPERGSGKLNNKEKEKDKGKQAKPSPCQTLVEKPSPQSPSCSRSASRSSNDMNAELINFMQSIQSAVDKQRDTVNSICNRLDRLESYESYPDEGYEYAEASYGGYEYDPAIETFPDEGSGQKRKAEEACMNEEESVEVSRFASMTKRFKVQEICDSDIDQTLAENVTELFHNGIEEDRYTELTKESKNARPQNCEGLVTVKTNQLIWDGISPNARLNDKKMQNIETSVVKAATIVVKVVNQMAKIEKDQDNTFGKLIDDTNDVLALLGHSNKQINTVRKDLLKPELKDEYVHLCNHNRPFTKSLFGDDISKSAKEIEDCAKISSKMVGYRHNRSMTGYRVRSHTRPMRWRGLGRMQGYHRPHGMPFNPDHPQNDPKNFQWKGLMAPRTKFQ